MIESTDVNARSNYMQIQGDGARPIHGLNNLNTGFHSKFAFYLTWRGILDSSFVSDSNESLSSVSPSRARCASHPRG